MLGRVARCCASILVALAAVQAAGRCDGGFNIVSLGAVPGVDTYQQAIQNGDAFAKAVAQANASSIPSQRAVLVPNGTFSFLPASAAFTEVSELTVCIEADLRLYTANFTSLYPTSADGKKYPAIAFARCNDVTVISETGSGVIDGRGSEWWWYKLLVGGERPSLLHTQGCRNVHVEGLTLLNSPCNHADLMDSINLSVVGVTVLVDLDEQLQIARYIAGVDPDATDLTRSQVASQLAKAQEYPKGVMHSDRKLPARVITEFGWSLSSWAINPPFPMVYAVNTDGIDFSGVNVSVTNCSVTNFDDTVCVKPIYPEISIYETECTSQVYIADIDVVYGVGISMGSVPPDVTVGERGNCIDGVVVENAVFTEPLKAVYVKPNPAKPQANASGTIANVIYQSLEVHEPLWWAIWISTQQMTEDGYTTGCSFLYPILNSSCPTDPQVSVRNITLRDVAIYNPVLSPGVIRMNETNPGTSFLFDGVVVHNASTWPADNYLCANIQGVATGGTSPVPPCFTSA